MLVETENDFNDGSIKSNTLYPGCAVIIKGNKINVSERKNFIIKYLFKTSSNVLFD